MAYTTIDDPSAYFQIATYTGAGANQTVTNDGNSDLQPDWLWIKRRNAGYAHALFDSNRGLGSSNPPMLESDSTAVENSNQNWISGVGTDSFTIGINEQNLSNTAGTYVAWQWKANGGTTSSNTDGSITSTVQVNQDAGFSIVTYSPANNTARNIGHGLGTTPSVVITRARNRVEDWRVFHSGAGSTGSLNLNDTSAHNSSTVLHTGVASTTFGVGTDFSVNGAYNYISYVFAEKQGYSKFGKYTGNGNSDGAFVYTGFKPAFIMIKRSDSTSNWTIWDSKRDPFNYGERTLFPNGTSAEESGNANEKWDILSNGFKFRSNGRNTVSGGTYIYMAFAESPFVTSTGIPTTAR